VPGTGSAEALQGEDQELWRASLTLKAKRMTRRFQNRSIHWCVQCVGGGDGTVWYTGGCDPCVRWGTTRGVGVQPLGPQLSPIRRQVGGGDGLTPVNSEVLGGGELLTEIYGKNATKKPKVSGIKSEKGNSTSQDRGKKWAVVTVGDGKPKNKSIGWSKNGRKRTKLGL